MSAIWLRIGSYTLTQLSMTFAHRILMPTSAVFCLTEITGLWLVLEYGSACFLVTDERKEGQLEYSRSTNLA